MQRKHRHWSLAINWLLVVTALVQGCSAWHYRSSEPARVLESEIPSAIAVTLTDSTHYVLSGPFIRYDSLVGNTKDGPRAVLLDSVERIAVKEFDVGRTLLFVAAIPVALVVSAMVFCGTDGCVDRP